jgi:hypothetical protein
LTQAIGLSLAHEPAATGLCGLLSPRPSPALETVSSPIAPAERDGLADRGDCLAGRVLPVVRCCAGGTGSKRAVQRPRFGTLGARALTGYSWRWRVWCGGGAPTSYGGGDLHGKSWGGSAMAEAMPKGRNRGRRGDSPASPWLGRAGARWSCK